MKNNADRFIYAKSCLGKYFLFFGLLLVYADICVAQQIAEKLDSLMNQYHQDNRFSGTILVAEKGRVLYKKGFGKANAEWDIPNTTKTKFRIGSVTKQFTAMLVLQLVNEGKIRLDAKITDYVPDYPVKNGSKITIHHLLSHTSGLPHYAGIPDFFVNKSRQSYRHEDFIKLFSSLDLLFEPGERYSYSSFGYYLLGYILERVSGKTYSALLRERILTPLKMHDTGVDEHIPLLSNRAAGYEQSIDGLRNAEYRDMTTALATGDMYSTVEDYLIWERALYTDKLLPASLKKLLYTPHTPNYGYGWVLEKIQGQRNEEIPVFMHTGGTNGFVSLAVRVPSEEKLVVMMANVSPTFNTEIINEIYNVLYDRPVNFKKSIANELRKMVLKQGVDAALVHYKKVKKDHPEEYNFGESELDRVADMLLADNRVADSIELLKLNTQIYPQSAGAFASLGNAYNIANNKTAAIESYTKAVELNPNNNNFKETLATLKKEIK